MTQTTKSNKATEQFQLHPSDTGSPQVQVTRLTEKINELTTHLQQHRKDFSSRQGLLKMVSRRRNLLEYIKRHDEDSYRKLLEALSLRK